MSKLFKSLRVVEESGDGLVFNWGYAALGLLLVQAVLFPSTTSALYLATAFAFVAYNSFLTPPVKKATKHEVDKLTEDLKTIRAEMGQLKMYFGFDPSKRKFSMFNKEVTS